MKRRTFAHGAREVDVGVELPDAISSSDGSRARRARPDLAHVVGRLPRQLHLVALATSHLSVCLSVCLSFRYL